MPPPRNAVPEWNMDLNARELSGLFIAHGWRYGNAPFPKPDDVAECLQMMVEHLRTSGKGYVELGRFVVYRDMDHPNSYEVAIKVGYVSDLPKDQDKADPNDKWGSEL